MLRKIFVVSSLLLAFSAVSFAQDSRHFTFHYAFTVKNLPAGKKVRVWIPVAQSDAYQEVKIVSAKGDLPLKKNRDTKSGNDMYFSESRGQAGSELHFDVEYEVVRHERLAFGSVAHVTAASLNGREHKEWLQPDALVPITGLPAELAVKVTEGKTQPLDKARAIYDYVFATLKYDK